MKKRTMKSGKTFYYCENCGKKLYSAVPVKSGIFIFGIEVPEEKTTERFCEFKMVSNNRKLNVKGGNYCKECADKLPK